MYLKTVHNAYVCGLCLVKVFFLQAPLTQIRCCKYGSMIGR